MHVRELGDPRLQALFGAGELKEPGVRPIVRLPRKGVPGWVFAGFALIAAVLLFLVLESRRTAPAEPSVSARAGDAPLFAPEPPPLYIPPAPAPEIDPVIIVPQAEAAQGSPGEAAAQQPMAAPSPAPQSYYPPEAFPAPMPEPIAPPARASSGPVLVIDSGAPASPASGEAGAAVTAGSGSSVGRMATVRRTKASALANRSLTVAQGTLIPAVLETAFDSTRPGFARAIVSRDVRGFDGTQVLIPRGSRLVGEYGSEVTPGQNRALISWTRLVRPDGMMIAIDSPAVDPQGRGGVRASVNSHFLKRFANGLLQTVMNVGGMFAARSASTPVVVALPGSGQSAAPAQSQSTRIAPTLKVAAGTSISIFVAHDLEFGSGEAGR